MNSEKQNIRVITFLFSNTSQWASIYLYWHFTLTTAPLREVVPVELFLFYEGRRSHRMDLES